MSYFLVRLNNLQFFLKRGQNLASQAPGQSIEGIKPKEVSFKEVVRNQKAGGLARAFGASNAGESVEKVGFQGPISNISKGELDLISNAFLRREQNIQQRRSQPGRSNLFFGRS